MKKLTVVIVNYNVKYFLEQCLHSVRTACEGIDAEVIIVDNNSVDGSNDMVQEKFPEYQLIANKENLGFSKANNQAMRIAKGEYILLLNPDTVVEADTFSKCIEFMDDHPDAGGLGVKMVDGSGKFLPESKRSLPTPAVSFYKIFGLSTLFPKSKRFGKYHLGYLDNDEVHEIEIMSGAYMMMRKEALDKTGLLDEDYFMYGEDIDLSYRLILAGYKNYYFPHTRIIHYKGESTKKSSINYVFVFYNAMIIFAKKHFSQNNARLFSFLIKTAIYFRASLSVFKRFAFNILLPLLDILTIFGGLFFIKNYWENNIRFIEGGSYPPEFLQYAVPAYIAVWIVSIFFNGGYDRPIRIPKVIQGLGIGTIIILVIYALLPENMRFSRAIILLGFFWSSVTLSLLRYLLSLSGSSLFSLSQKKQKRFAIIGEKDEAVRVEQILRKAEPDAGFIGLVDMKESDDHKTFIGNIHQIGDIVDIYDIDELIFCSKNIHSKQIIDLMTSSKVKKIEYKIAPPESMFLIGSNSIHSPGELYLLDANAISSVSNKRNKRLLDIALSTALLLTFPLNFILIKSKGKYFRNLLNVLTGRKTFVGYQLMNHESDLNLPGIKKGILFPSDFVKKAIDNEDMIFRLNLLYARDYSISFDLRIILKNFSNLGR